MNEKFKYALDAGAAGVTGLAYLQYLPYIAAAVSIVWGLIRIYETATIQKLLGKKNAKTPE